MSQDDHHQNIKIQDSLDNLSNTKLRQSSLQKQRIQLIQTKQKFVSFLQKLQSSQTRQISLSQIKKLLQQNNQSDHLKIYLAILKTLKPNHNSATKQHEILVISILAQCFKQNLIDRTDKQPNILKTCFKVVQILLGFFNDNSTTVQQACARVLLDLNQYCLLEGKIDKQQKLSVLFTPLISILKNGVDKASQATATVCINELVKFWYSHQEKQYLDNIAKEIFQILLRLNSQYHEIFMTTIILIDHKKLAFFQNRLPNFLAKILPIINGTRDGANNFNAYMCRVNVCKIIEKVAILLTAQQRDKLVDLNVFGSLEKAARNKIIQVQMAATRAIKAWRGQPVSQQRVQRKSNSQGKGLKSLQQMRDQKKRQRSNSKQNTIKIQNQLNYMKQDLQKMVKGGWGANNRAKNYVKRGQGVGGGHYGQIQYSTPPKNNKSHKQHLQQLRQIIKKGAKQNKNMDKFQLVKQQTGMLNKQYQNNGRQIPTSSNNNVIPQLNLNKKKSEPDNSGRKNDNAGRLPDKNQQQNDFQLVQDQGQQMINIQPKSKLNKKQSGGTESNSKSPQFLRMEKYTINPDIEKQADDFVMDSQQAKQLLQQERLQNLQHINQDHHQSNFKSNFNSSQQQKPQKSKQLQVKDQKFIQRSSKIKQNLAQLAPMISEQQLQQLMLQNNLSQVSDNISNCLNASDFNYGDNDVNVPENDRDDGLQLVQSKQQESVDPARFMRKANQSMKSQNKNEGKFQVSLNYTDSRVTRMQNSIKNNDGKNSPSRQNDPRAQFTLNPNNIRNDQSRRFQSIHDQNQNLNHEQQIEEDIVQSCFQQSHQNNENNILPLKTKIQTQKQSSSSSPANRNINKKSNNVVVQIQQLNQQQISKNYQQLIQRPPANYKSPNYMDTRSRLGQKSVEENQNSQFNEQYDDQQQDQTIQTVTDKWIKILSLVQSQEFNQAFQLAYDLDDPIYLIRLLLITKTPISSLTAQNCTRLWQKFLDIYKHNFISILFVQLFTQANDLNLVKSSLTIQEMHELLLKLYEVSGTSKGKLSFNAALLYNNIDQKLRPKKD